MLRQAHALPLSGFEALGLEILHGLEALPQGPQLFILGGTAIEAAAALQGPDPLPQALNLKVLLTAADQGHQKQHRQHRTQAYLQPPQPGGGTAVATPSPTGTGARATFTKTPHLSPNSGACLLRSPEIKGRTHGAVGPKVLQILPWPSATGQTWHESAPAMATLQRTLP